MLPPPIPANEADRLCALQRYLVLDTQPEACYEDVVGLARQICQVPIALVSLVDSERQWFKARVGLDATETPRHISFCGHAILGDSVFVVADAATDSRFADNPLVTGDPHIRSYAGAPIVAPDGQRLGTVCVIDFVPRQLTAAQLTALQALARQVAAHLESRRQCRALVVTNHELSAAQRRLDLVVDATCDGVWEWDAASQRIECSARTRQLLGQPAEAHAVAFASTWSTVHPADRRRLLRQVVAHRRSDATFEVELRLLLVGGAEHWFRLRCRIVPASDQAPERCIGAIADVHDRRIADRALDRLRALLAESQAQAHVGGWELDLQAGALSWTEQTYRIHDLPPHSQLPTLEQAIEYYAESARPVIRAAVAAAIADGTPYVHELELVTAKGRRIWVMATGRAVHENGVAVRLVGAFQDITASKRAAAELTAAKEAAEIASRAKGSFLATMSHEIRTPMHGVLGYAELLRNTPLSEEQRGHVDVITRSGTALLSLIDDILDFSKVEAGKLAVERLAIDVRQVADEVVLLLQTRAAEKGIRLHLDTGTEPHLFATADPARLRQVLLNLVGNAVKFTVRGEVRIALARHGDQIRCAVVDTGIGIAPAEQPRLFREFEQVEDTTRRRHGGTGLGLAISRRLVEAMGGCIGMSSEPGLGSTFWFALPAAVAPSADVVPKVGKLAEPALPTSVRVLVAEDNQINQRLVGAMLRHAGLHVDMAQDGAEAIELATTRSYDLVLMDCLMPGTDGFDATRAIRGHEVVHGGHVPIIALTANAMAEDRAVCLAAGMDDFVSKPFTRQVLLATVSKWLLADAAGRGGNGARG